MNGFEWGDEWDHVADVVVVGCGAAGASAAATAAACGASVVVLEKAPVSGGTTAKSGGVMWIPDNPLMRAAGIADPRDAAIRYMARTAYPVLYDPSHPTLGLPADRLAVIEAFYDGGSAAIEFLVGHGALSIEAVDYPDYYAHLPEDQAPLGRVIQPRLPPGWTAGRDPQGGQLLVDQLVAFAEQRGATVLFDHEAAHLVRYDDGTVVGLEARTGTRTVLVGARGGVVFTSGGFLHDPRLVLDHLRGPVLGGAAVQQATGDFVRIAGEIGAPLGNMAHAWWDQCVVELAARHRSTTGDVYSAFGDSMIMVNRFGVRCVNEKAPYNERGQAHFVWDPYRGEYPNLLMFMIWDEGVRTSPERTIFRWPVPLDDRPRHYIATADTFEELAVELGARLERLSSFTGGVRLDPSFVANLEATVARFDRYARQGHDPEFARGATPIEQRWAGPARDGMPSGTMHPFSPTGPYHCVILGPGALDTKGGPLTDGTGRVLDTSFTPIPGLYGAGNCVASPAGQAYWGPGGTIGPAVTFGHLAARHAADRARSVRA